MRLELDENEAEALIECIESAYSEGQGGDVRRIVAQILDTYPALEEAFGYLRNKD